MKPKSEWTADDYAEQIRAQREKAVSLRRRADEMDADADALSRETVKFKMDELPIFKGESCKPARQS